VYLRILKFDTQGADLYAVQAFYQKEVLPLLQQHSACRFASLLQATSQAEECISMTLWDSPQEADSYEKSDAYRKLVEDGSQLVSGAAEWRVRLAGSTGLPPVEPGQQTVSDAFTVEAGDEDLPVDELPSRLYLRVVSVRVKPEKWDDLIDLYNTTVMPTLHSTQGCRAAFLVEALRDPDQALSVSIWDREEDAVRYEISGRFDALTRRLRDTLIPTHQWQGTLTAEGSADGNPPAEGFRVVVGERFSTR